MSSKIESTARLIAEAFKGKHSLSQLSKEEKSQLENRLMQLCDDAKAADDPSHEQFRQAAKEQYGESGRIEIDTDALVSKSEDGGAYVQAWVYIEL